MARIGLIAAVLLLGAAAIAFRTTAPDDSVRTIEIDIEHSRFRPASIRVDAGERVRFVIRNTDPIDHEFIVGAERVQQVHERGTEAHHGAKPGEISVPALGTAETTYLFDTPGTLIFGCHLPTHYSYGMRGTITIHQPLSYEETR